MIRLIALKELRGLLHAPSTWIILGVLQFFLAMAFMFRLEAYLELQPQFALIANAPGATAKVVPSFFIDPFAAQGDVFSKILTFCTLIIIITSLFAMRLISEERRNQTLALLLSSPVSMRQIVLGKFFGLTAFLWGTVLWTTAMLYTLRMGTPIDTGLLFTNCVGMLLLSASFAALALYISSLTAQPMVAAIGALTVLLGLYRIETDMSGVNPLWRVIAPTAHFRSFNGGLLDSADIVYYLLFCGFFLSLTIRRLRQFRLHD